MTFWTSSSLPTQRRSRPLDSVVTPGNEAGVHSLMSPGTHAPPLSRPFLAPDLRPCPLSCPLHVSHLEAPLAWLPSPLPRYQYPGVVWRKLLTSQPGAPGNHALHSPSCPPSQQPFWSGICHPFTCPSVHSHLLSTYLVPDTILCIKGTCEQLPGCGGHGQSNPRKPEGKQSGLGVVTLDRDGFLS